MILAQFTLLAAATYVLCGLVFAVMFVVRGVQRIEHGTVGTRWPCRLIIFPGAVALWPILLSKLTAASREQAGKSSP